MQQAPLIRKYNVLIEPNNTPFEYEGKGVGSVRRLWSYLVQQESLLPYFVKYIFTAPVYIFLNITIMLFF